MNPIIAARSRAEILRDLRAVAISSGTVDISDIQPAELGAYAYLSASSNSFTFDFGKTSNTAAFDKNVLLGQNDVFIATAVALEIVKAAFANGKASGQNIVGYSYPDKGIHTASNEAAALESLYNANFKFVTDQKERLNRNTAFLRSVPRTQFASASTPSKEAIAYRDLISTQFLHGRQSNQAIITLPVAAAAISPAEPATATYCNLAGVLLDGFIIKNAATNDDFFNAYNQYVLSAVAKTLG